MLSLFLHLGENKKYNLARVFRRANQNGKATGAAKGPAKASTWTRGGGRSMDLAIILYVLILSAFFLCAVIDALAESGDIKSRFYSILLILYVLGIATISYKLLAIQ